MSAMPNNIPKQEMPPPGGFPRVDQWDRPSFKPRGPKGWQLWLGSAVLIGWGYTRIGKTNHERNMQKAQMRKIRYAVAPLLQIEADREYLLREREILKNEAQIMKGTKFEESFKNGMPSPYFSNKWMPRHINSLDYKNE